MLVFGEVVLINLFLRDVIQLDFDEFGMIKQGPKVNVCNIKAGKVCTLAG